MKLPEKFTSRGIWPVFFMGLFVFFSHCGEKETPEPKRKPTVTTLGVIDWAQFSVTFRGDVSSAGNDSITDKGIVYSSANPSPELADNKVSAGPGSGPFRLEVTGLPQKTLYYYRTYAVNGQGTSYGDVFKISTTYGPTPTIITEAVQVFRGADDSLGLTLKLVAVGGTGITDLGFEVTENTPSSNPPRTEVKLTATEPGTYTGVLKGTFLKPNATYTVVAFATNLAGREEGKPLAAKTSGPGSVITNSPRLTTDLVTFTGRTTDRGQLPTLRRGFIWVESSSTAASAITFSTANVRVINLPDGGENTMAYSFAPGDSVEVGKYYRLRAFTENVQGISYDAATLRFRFLPLGALVTLTNGAKGHIFWVDPGNSSLRALIVEETDMDTTATWGCHSDSINTTAGIAFKAATGLSSASTDNTNAMATCAEPAAAGKYARTTGVTGWDIPSSAALRVIYDSLFVTNRLTNFSGKYWSSTQGSERVDSQAFSFDFSPGVADDKRLKEEKKYLRYNVRRIRGF